MHRRDLFKVLAGLGVVGVSVKATPPRKHGLLTVQSHRAHKVLTGETLRVYVDGVKVSKCYEANDIEGYALAYCTDKDQHRDLTAKGHAHLGGGGGDGACRLRLIGNVVITAEKVGG